MAGSCMRFEWGVFLLSDRRRWIILRCTKYKEGHFTVSPPGNTIVR
ncbi:MAG: hypothetical protein OJF50_002580 [Nitrospira sp.]|nr:hypothetical protein [Nitrospira sp.]